MHKLKIIHFISFLRFTCDPLHTPKLMNICTVMYSEERNVIQRSVVSAKPSTMILRPISDTGIISNNSLWLICFFVVIYRLQTVTWAQELKAYFYSLLITHYQIKLIKKSSYKQVLERCVLGCFLCIFVPEWTEWSELNSAPTEIIHSGKGKHEKGCVTATLSYYLSQSLDRVR